MLTAEGDMRPTLILIQPLKTLLKVRKKRPRSDERELPHFILRQASAVDASNRKKPELIGLSGRTLRPDEIDRFGHRAKFNLPGPCWRRFRLIAARARRRPVRQREKNLCWPEPPQPRR